MTPPNTIETYVDANGRSVFSEWLAGLKDRKAYAIVLNRIDRLRVGNLGYCRDLKDSVWEMKIDFGPGYRVYFARSGKTIYLLLAGGSKSTQDTDIKEAKKRWAEYKKRMNRK
jgi:putative addiction module killer protein